MTGYRAVKNKFNVLLLLIIFVPIQIFLINYCVCFSHPIINPSSEPNEMARILLAVGIDNESNWRDFLALASFPVQSKLNSSTSLCVSLLFPTSGLEITESQSEFISQYKPTEIFAIGLQSLESYNINMITNPSSEVNGSCEIASCFWEQSETIVITKSVPVNDEQCYRNAIMASNLASSLNVPLIYVHEGELQEYTKDTLERLSTKNIFIIGDIDQSALSYFTQKGILFRQLSSAADVASIILENKDSEYLVVTNPADRNSTYVNRLSLLASSLAAGRDGIVYPLSEIPLYSQKQFNVNILTSEEPIGVLPSATYILKGIISLSAHNTWTSTQDPPLFANDSTLTVYPVNGTYAHVNAPWTFPGGAWEYILDDYHMMYLAASKANQTGFDVLLFDKSCETLSFNNDEIFKEGDIIPLRHDCPYWICNIKVEKLDPNGTLVLRYQFWKNGCIAINGVNYEFVLVCSDPGALGTYNALYIDFNTDGRFDGKNEGPYVTGDSIDISGKSFDVAIDPYGMYVDIIGPSSKEIRSQMILFCHEISFSPKYLAIMGLMDSIPYAITKDPKNIFLPPHEIQEYIPTDVEYGRIENQDLPSSLTGRIFAKNIFEASCLIARTLSYNFLRQTGIEWNREALIFGTIGSCDQLQASMYLNLNNSLKNANYIMKGFNSLQDLQNKSIIYLNGHGTPYSINLGAYNLEINTNWTIQTPTFVLLDSCNIGNFPNDVDVNSYLLNVLLIEALWQF